MIKLYIILISIILCSLFSYHVARNENIFVFHVGKHDRQITTKIMMPQYGSGILIVYENQYIGFTNIDKCTNYMDIAKAYINMYNIPNCTFDDGWWKHRYLWYDNKIDIIGNFQLNI